MYNFLYGLSKEFFYTDFHKFPSFADIRHLSSRYRETETTEEYRKLLKDKVIFYLNQNKRYFVNEEKRYTKEYRAESNISYIEKYCQFIEKTATNFYNDDIVAFDDFCAGMDNIKGDYLKEQITIRIKQELLNKTTMDDGDSKIDESRRKRKSAQKRKQPQIIEEKQVQQNKGGSKAQKQPPIPASLNDGGTNERDDDEDKYDVQENEYYSNLINRKRTGSISTTQLFSKPSQFIVLNNIELPDDLDTEISRKYSDKEFIWKFKRLQDALKKSNKKGKVTREQKDLASLQGLLVEQHFSERVAALYEFVKIWLGEGAGYKIIPAEHVDLDVAQMLSILIYEEISLSDFKDDANLGSDAPDPFITSAKKLKKKIYGFTTGRLKNVLKHKESAKKSIFDVMY